MALLRLGDCHRRPHQIAQMADVTEILIPLDSKALHPTYIEFNSFAESPNVVRAAGVTARAPITHAARLPVKASDHRIDDIGNSHVRCRPAPVLCRPEPHRASSGSFVSVVAMGSVAAPQVTGRHGNIESAGGTRDAADGVILANPSSNLHIVCLTVSDLRMNPRRGASFPLRVTPRCESARCWRQIS